MALIHIEGLKKEYSLGKKTIYALRGIDLEIERGEFLCIAGPSGSGKTTLLNIIGCLDTPTCGSIIIDNCNITSLKENDLVNIRSKEISFIFQSFSLLPVLTVYENVELPLILQGKKVNREKILDLLDKVNLSKYKDTKPENLSGGEQQRVAIIRALVTDPNIVLADEPTSNLDSQTAVSIIEFMRKMNEVYKKTFIFTSHDERVMKHSSRLVKIQDGTILI